MSSNTNFTEWTREEKEKFAQKRMAEMKLKNDMLKRRHAEVEFDRMAAEKQNSAITNVPKPVKNQEVKIKIETYSEAREWDRGKPDMHNWRSPQHSAPIFNSRSAYNKRDLEHPPRTSFDRTDNRNFWQKDSQRKTPLDRRDNKDSFHRNKSFESNKYGPSMDSKMKSRKEFRSKQFDHHHSASYRYKSPEKRVGFGHRTNDSYRKPHTYSDERSKKFDVNRLRKKLSSGAHSQSTSRSDSDHADNVTSMKISSVRVESLWENDKVSEDRNKQNRTENWVKSVSGRSYSKWDNESSDEDKKNLHSKFASGEIKSSECGTTYNPEKHANAEMGSNILSERVKGIKAKRSPQSINSSKNEHARKQRRFDRGFREEDASNYPKFEQQSYMKSKDDMWNDSVGNKNIRNERCSQKMSNFVKDKTVKKLNDDIWEGVNQDYYGGGTWGDGNEDNRHCGKDDMWESVEQSDVKWTLSDDETTWNENKLPSDKVDKRTTAKGFKSQKLHNNRDSHENQGDEAYDDDNPDNLWNKFKKDSANIDDNPDNLWNKFKKDSANVDDNPDNLWNKFKKDSANVDTKDSYKGQEAAETCDEDPDNLWNKFKQDSYNAEASNSKMKIPKSAGACESGEYGYDLNDPFYLSKKLKESCKISDKMETVEDKTAHSSDDSWLTEEGEIHSDDEGANSGKNKGSTPQ